MTPNQQITAFYKRFKQPNNYSEMSEKEKDQFWKNQEALKKEIVEAITKTGFISVLSKQSLLRLIEMGSSLRFMEPFRLLSLIATN